MISSNCPGCKKSWPFCSCYTCRKCRKTTGCTCRNVTSVSGGSLSVSTAVGGTLAANSGGISANVYTSGNAGWYTTTMCGKCSQPLHNCICISFPNISPTIYPMNPLNPIGGGSLVPCAKCGGIQGMCACSNVVPAVFHFTPVAPTLEIISDFQIFDIYTNKELETGHSLTIVHRDNENGFYGTMPYIKLPLDMAAYFIKYGSPVGEGPVWQMLSPLLFKMKIRDQKTLEESTHFATMLDFYDILDQKDELFMQTPRFQEVVDNFVSLRLIARDSAYRKSLGRQKPSTDV